MTDEYCDYCQDLQREIVACGCNHQARERYAKAFEEKPKKASEVVDLSTIQIEKDVPLPDTDPLTYRKLIARMEVGDSVFLPGRRAGHIKHATGGFNPVRKFTTRTGEGGMRVWRIE